MDNVKRGFFWHGHDDTLVEWSDNIDMRVKEITDNKPKDEIETRLRLIRLVKGKLPVELVQAWETYCQVWRAHFGAPKFDQARAEAKNQARDAYKQAQRACMPAIEALHAVECPNCPWDGKTIFPQKD